MNTRVSIIFPYLGDDDEVREKLTRIVEATLNKEMCLHTSKTSPLLVVNKDTVNRNIYAKYEKYLSGKGKSGLLTKLEIIKVWSVDTCQMWLDGFGTIIDNRSEDDPSSVLQIPGDLKYIRDFDTFINRLRDLTARMDSGNWDFVIGDFDVEPHRSKHLIDSYGTYPLLFNWFPEVGRKLHKGMKIGRPRSEFLAVSLDFLSSMLAKRKFAYEQTLAFLIHAFLDKETKWRIGKVDLGNIGDYEPGRGFREANDQIERTERLLKCLWREKNGGDHFKVGDFERLDRRSTAIREAAIVSLENFLKK